MTERDAYISLNMIEGLGPVTVRALIDVLGSPQAVLEAGEAELIKVRGVGPKLASAILNQREGLDPVAQREQAVSVGARILTLADADYPESLKAIHDPPLALYIHGTLERRDRHAVALVGARQCTHYGIRMADRLAYGLAQSGIIVTSGLARGIDTAAHEGALKAGGRTIAVLGGALDCLYPPENEKLARRIAEAGAVVSEYPFGRQADRQTFPYRNRIISGLSMGIVVVEADVKSGALHTADAASEQGRTIFAVPGPADSASSRGTNRLIKNGAKLVDNTGDILEEFDLLIPREQVTSPAEKLSARPEVPLSDDEQTVLKALWGESLDVDQLARKARLPSARVSVLLVGLEMKRVVRILPGRMVELAEDLRRTE